MFCLLGYTWNSENIAILEQRILKVRGTLLQRKRLTLIFNKTQVKKEIVEQVLGNHYCKGETPIFETTMVDLVSSWKEICNIFTIFEKSVSSLFHPSRDDENRFFKRSELAIVGRRSFFRFLRSNGSLCELSLLKVISVQTSFAILPFYYQSDKQLCCTLLKFQITFRGGGEWKWNYTHRTRTLFLHARARRIERSNRAATCFKRCHAAARMENH